MILPELARCGQSSLILMFRVVRRLSDGAAQKVRQLDSTVARQADGCATDLEARRDRVRQMFYQVIPLADDALDYVERRWHTGRYSQAND